MATYVQFKDGVAYAHVTTDSDLSNMGFVEVEGTGHDYLNQVYADGVWSDAPEIRYAILDSTNTIVQINTTYFSSEVGSNTVITDPAVKVNWTWDGVKFNPPVEWRPITPVVEPVEVIHYDNKPMEITEGTAQPSEQSPTT